MTISQVKLFNLKAQDKAYQESDGDGLFVEVSPCGAKTWLLHYQLADQQETVTLGKYPTYSLTEARQWRSACTALVKQGLSPMALKRGDAIPDDVKPEAKELADAFLKNWCQERIENNISEIKLRSLKTQDKAYQESDGDGLFVEVLTCGAKTWLLHYQLAGQPETVTLGKYPTYSLAEARQWRSACTALVKQGLSPMALKRGDAIPDDVKPEAKKLANTFLKNWCQKRIEKNLTSGAKTRLFRYQLAGQPEKVTLGKSSTYSLTEARQWRSACITLVKQGLSPMALKRGDAIPDDVKPEAKELAAAFLKRWYQDRMKKNLSEVKLLNLKAQDKTYQEPDGGGLFIEVPPRGAKIWRLRYRLADQAEKLTLGKYPTYSLTEARQWRAACATLVKHGLSPMALKRGDAIPSDAKPEAKELAAAFLKNWCQTRAEKTKVEKKTTKTAKPIAGDTLEAFARRLDADIAGQSSKSRTAEHAQEKDDLSAAGGKQIADAAATDVLLITDNNQDRDTDQIAPQNRNVFKRLFAYVRPKKTV